MKTKAYFSVFKNILGRSTISFYSGHRQFISESKLFLRATNQLRLKYNFQFSSFSSIEAEKLLNRPEIQDYLKLVSDEFDKLENPGKKITPVLSICIQIKEYKEELTNLLHLNPENDEEMQNLINAEKNNFLNKIKRLSSELITYALPKDDDYGRVSLSVAPGIGGEEAKLFAGELFDMYLNYARYKGWVISCIDKLVNDRGGINRAEVTISGESVFRFLKHEAGIHRVQRVPVTEKSGKMQTSTCKVNIVPEIECDEIVLESKDLKFETKTSSGPGGQNVNKLETCVRVTHIPTGHTVECQSERLQALNKLIALKKLKNILYQEQQDVIHSNLKELKAEQAVTVHRSDKIRTYNFLQNRVTDHRINYTTHHIEKFMEGEKSLDEMVLQIDTNYHEEYVVRNINRLLKKKNVNELFKI